MDKKIITKLNLELASDKAISIVSKNDTPISFTMIGNGKRSRSSNLKSVDLIKEMISMGKAEIFAVYILQRESRWMTDAISNRQYSDGISEIRSNIWETDYEHKMFQRGFKLLKAKGLAIKLNNRQYMINPLAIVPSDREVAIRQWNMQAADEFIIVN